MGDYEYQKFLRIDHEAKKASGWYEKQRQQNIRDKMGVILQGLIADGVVSSDLFGRALEKYITDENDRQQCNVYFDEHRPKGD